MVFKLYFNCVSIVSHSFISHCTYLYRVPIMNTSINIFLSFVTNLNIVTYNMYIEYRSLENSK